MTSPRSTRFSPAFRALWSASAVSNVVDGLLKTSVPLLAATLTHDPLLIALLSALVMLPWLLFAIPIGGLVDRINRRQMLVVANTIRLSAAFFLACVVGFDLISLPLLFLASFIFGIGEVMYDTTLQAMIPQVLEPHQLEKGNSRLEVTSVTLGEFVGTPLGGALYAVAIGLPFALGAAGVFVAVILVAAVPRAYSIQSVPATVAVREKFWVDIRSGISYLVSNRTLLKLVLFTSSVGFFFSASGSTMVLFALNTLQVPVALFGVVAAMPAFGALAGSMLAPRLSTRFGRTETMAIAMASSGVLIIAQGFAPNYWVLAATLMVSTLVVTVWNILLMSAYHQIIPSHLFGRVHGTRRTLVWGLMPLGSMLGGLIATIDLRLPFIVGGAASLIVAVLGFRFIVNLKMLIPATEAE